MTEAMKDGNPLRVWVEPFCELPVDKDALKGETPPLQGLLPFSPFSYYIKRKLFIHNMGHAICAYLGWRKGYTYIWECAQDDDIRGTARAAMAESAAALRAEYKTPAAELEAHIDDLLSRFENKALGDTVARVGNDPVRKLSRNDRLIGAALYCGARGMECTHILEGILAALRYDNPADKAAVRIQETIAKEGAEAVLRGVSGLSEDEPLFDAILKAYIEI